MQPQKLSDIFGLADQKRELANFIDNFKSQKKKVLLLHGPVGTGKTSIIHAISKEKNYELLEINGSDRRKADDISSIIGNAVKQRSLFYTGKIILIDEVDGIHGNYDRGGVAELAKIASITKTPIIMTCNDVWKSSLSGLRAKCKLIEFKSRTKNDIIAVLRQACVLYNIRFDENSLTILAEKSQGDVRAALNDLQVSVEDNKIDEEFVQNLEPRDIETDIFSGMQKIFRGIGEKEVIQTSNSINLDLQNLFMWLSENIPAEIQDRRKMIEALDYLSEGDIYLGRIRKQRYYRYMWYSRLISILGVNLSNKRRTYGWTKYSRPSRLLKIWNTANKRKLRKSILSRVAKDNHTSQRVANETYFLLLKILAKTNKIPENYFDEKELEFLRG